MVESWPARLMGERTAGVVASAARTAVNGGSGPLIFVPRATHTGNRDCRGHGSDGGSWHIVVLPLDRHVTARRLEPGLPRPLGGVRSFV
jgi:hypothetical protein